MDLERRLDFAIKQLERINSQFARVDSRTAILLGADLGILGLLAINLPSFKTWEGYLFAAVFPVLTVAVSIFYLYKSQFPNFAGGRGSLLYFREIALRPESTYLSEMEVVSTENLLKDVLAQIWRNSEILTEKFSYMKSAMLWLAVSIPLAVVALMMFAYKNPALIVRS